MSILFGAGVYYVARVRPNLSKGDSLKLESRPFDPARDPEDRPGYALQMAQDWRDYIQTLHPKDEVIVIQVMSNE
jgi:hypothetical protein